MGASAAAVARMIEGYAEMSSVLIALALQAVIPAADPFAARAWGRIERSEALSHVSTTIDMQVDDREPRSGQPDHVFRLVGMRPAERPTVLWASSRTCPAVREVASLAGLPMPRPRPPGGEVVVVADGVQYSVTAPFGFGGVESGRLTIRSNVNTPLAAWVDGALAKLERCWSAKEPG